MTGILNTAQLLPRTARGNFRSGLLHGQPFISLAPSSPRPLKQTCSQVCLPLVCFYRALELMNFAVAMLVTALHIVAVVMQLRVHQ